MCSIHLRLLVWSPWDLGTWGIGVKHMLPTVCAVIKSFVSDPEVSYLLLALKNLWQANLPGWNRWKISDHSQFFTVWATRIGCWQMWLSKRERMRLGDMGRLHRNWWWMFSPNCPQRSHSILFSPVHEYLESEQWEVGLRQIVWMVFSSGRIGDASLWGPQIKGSMTMAAISRDL